MQNLVCKWKFNVRMSLEDRSLDLKPEFFYLQEGFDTAKVLKLKHHKLSVHSKTFIPYIITRA